MSIIFNDVTYVYYSGSLAGKAAVNHISLSIGLCEFVAVLGGPGSGKSTFLQLLAGILKPTSGTVTIAEKTVGMVFQFPERQFFDETVYKDLSFPLRRNGLSEEEIEKRVRESLASVDIDPEVYGDKSPFELSSGEKRRIAIASVLVLNPAIIALDDPLAGLDHKGKKDILSELKRLQVESGKTVVITTQETEIICGLCDRFIIIEDGKIMVDGSSELPDRPRLLGSPIQSLLNVLKDKGVDLGEGVLTVKEAFQRIKNLS